MTSKRQRNSGFLLPNPVTGYDTICVSLQIPNVRQYRAAFVGHLFKLANWWTWEKSYIGNDERAKEAAAMWRRLLVDTLQISECESGGTPVSSDCAHYIGDVFSNINNVPPEGCLPMSGGIYSQAEYPDLVPMLPPSWRDNGNGTFTLPNMAGRNPIGAGFTYYPPGSSSYVVPVGATDGEARHTLTENEMPQHDHDFKMSSGATAGTLPIQYSTPRQTVAGTYKTEVTGTDDPHNNMQPFLAVFWYIQATICQEQEQGEFDIRLSGCLLEYTLNGSMWFVVDGWTDYDNCLNIPAPFDLRFNNCTLEYSRDSAQTWDIVPGWADAATCFPGSWTPDDHSIRVDAGILQYTEDGGETWLNVFGWNTLQDDFLREKDRCLNAWGASIGLKRLSAKFAVGLLYETSINDYSEFVLTVWEEEFGLQPTPNALEAWITFTWSDSPAARSLHYNDIVSESDVTELAEYIYTASPIGEWCEENVTAFTDFLNCDNLPFDVESIMLFIAAMFEADAYWIKSQRARLFQMRDFGTCENCATLDEKEPCSPNWTKTVSDGDVIGTDGFVKVFGYDTPSGLLSEYLSGNAIAKCRLQGVQLDNGIALSVYVDWNGVTSPSYSITCDVDAVFTTLASGNTPTSPIVVPYTPGAITILQISALAWNTDSETTVITRIELSAPGECPFTTCD